jgi:aminomethyltransferase
VKVWDAINEKGKQFDLHAAGMLALDVARVEAGLLLIEVDYSSSKKALIATQKFSPYELGFAKMVHLGKENFIGKRALERDAKNGVARQFVGVEVDWTEVEALYERRPARLRAWQCLCIPATNKSARPQPRAGRRSSRR